ncbi:hypothetical protein ACGFYZ_19870 [Streptomyces sp. NPDC048330]|uniref:hypothetical protein n=1 Tax=Streptomyces sp. NPDC048330 TaxID=3365533 RepID=UPI003711ED29
MIVMRPVLEIHAADDFELWPIGEHEPYGHLVLNGEMTPERVGTAVMGARAEHHLPAHATAVSAALARALDLAPAP